MVKEIISLFLKRKRGKISFLKATVRVAKGAMYGGLSRIIREASYEVQECILGSAS
ncbi:MAG: hypothetical protein ACTSYM_08700 [Candidatus Baldrarchaeia archaeon]